MIEMNPIVGPTFGSSVLNIAPVTVKQVKFS
eukprot:COSAG01_NODE_13524_length_1573_cov_0.769335_1_plen_30_part_10